MLPNSLSSQDIGTMFIYRRQSFTLKYSPNSLSRTMESWIKVLVFLLCSSLSLREKVATEIVWFLDNFGNELFYLLRFDCHRHNQKGPSNTRGPTRYFIVACVHRSLTHMPIIHFWKTCTHWRANHYLSTGGQEKHIEASDSCMFIASSSLIVLRNLVGSTFMCLQGWKDSCGWWCVPDTYISASRFIVGWAS